MPGRKAAQKSREVAENQKLRLQKELKEWNKCWELRQGIATQM